MKLNTLSPLKALVAILVCACMVPGTGCVKPDSKAPEMVLYNGQIYTVSNPSWVGAIAVSGGRIQAVGASQEILALADSTTQVFDLQGRFAMPGFIEGHGHFSGLGTSLQNLNFLDAKSWDAVVHAVDSAVKHAQPGEWIIGFGWHQEKWTESPEPNILGYPYHHILSRVSPENPVMLNHASGHAVFANAAAMEAAGITSETPNPQGGNIVRDQSGDAIGIFEENAEDLISGQYQGYLTTLSAKQLEEKWYRGLTLAQEECLRKGVTSFQDAGSSIDEVRKISALAERGALDLRIWMMIRHTSEYLTGRLDDFPMINTANGFFTCRAVKISLDGALGSYGAWLLEPYTDNPGHYGQNTSSLDELDKLADICAKHGLQLCTHAIGDRANRETLDLYAAKFIQHNLNKNVRWRIEHAQHLHPDDIPRFGELGVVASMQGIHCTSDAPYVEKRLGYARAKEGAYVWRSLLESGAVVTNGTDAPVEDVDPIVSFYATVTRKRADSGMKFFPEQVLTREEAIYSYTMANAFAAFEEELKGSLEPGKYADLIVLSENLISCAEDAILNTRVLMTMVDGEIQYRAPDFE